VEAAAPQIPVDEEDALSPVASTYARFAERKDFPTPGLGPHTVTTLLVASTSAN